MSVRKIFWCPGDHMLFSAGMDGDLCGWSMLHDHRTDARTSLSLGTVRAAGRIITSMAADGVDVSVLGQAGRRAARGPKQGRLGACRPADSPIAPRRAPTVCWRRTQTARLGWARGTCLWAEKRPQPSPQTDRRLLGPRATRHDTRLASFVFITAVSISTDKKLVYAGTNTGALRVYEWPSAGRRGGAPFSELQALSAAVRPAGESQRFLHYLRGRGRIYPKVHDLEGAQHSLMLSGIDTSDMFDESSLYNSGV